METQALPPAPLSCFREHLLHPTAFDADKLVLPVGKRESVPLTFSDRP